MASQVTLLILFFLSVRWEYSGCLVGFLWELNEIHSYKDLKSGPVVVQSLGCVRLFAPPWAAACQASLSFTVSEFAQIHESVMLSNHLILCHPLLLLPQSFPASESFPVSRLFTSGGQSIGVSASALALPMNNQGWLHLGLTGLVSSLSRELSGVFSRPKIWKHQFFTTQSSLWSNCHICTWPLKKP